MSDYTPEQIAHQLELADALIENYYRQTVNELLHGEYVCAVGCAIKYTEFRHLLDFKPDSYQGVETLTKSDDERFSEYYGFSQSVLMSLNEKEELAPEHSGAWIKTVNKTFPEIADALKEGLV